jgi:hypothetical protein
LLQLNGPLELFFAEIRGDDALVINLAIGCGITAAAACAKRIEKSSL